MRISLLVALSVFSLSVTAGNVSGVYPAELKGKKSFELGELINLLIPAKGAKPGWDYLSQNKDIAWTTNGVEAGQGDNYHREGFLRVNVKGWSPTILRQKKEELGWALAMQSEQPRWQGPSRIEIEPLMDCFGETVSNCAFDLMPSLVASNISAEKLCEVKIPFSGGFERAYRITSKNKPPVILTYMEDYGSGGTSNSLAIFFTNDGNSVCTSIANK